MQGIGKKTPVTARLSTVVHERGCAFAFADLMLASVLYARGIP